MLYVFHGADDFRSTEALAELRTSLNSDGMLANNTSVLAGQGLTPAELTQHATAIPFLADARLVIVEGLITALGSRRGVADKWSSCIDVITQLPPSNHVVLLEPAPSRDDRQGISRSPLIGLLSNVPTVDIREFAKLRTWGRGGTSEVANWLLERAESRMIAIDREAIETLVDLIGADLRALDQELNKLAAYAAAKENQQRNGAAPVTSKEKSPITIHDVHLMTSQAREENIFALIDAIVEGQGQLALRQLRRVLDEASATPSFLQVMIARQLRNLIRSTELLERHASQKEIADATGLRGFPLTKLMKQARQISLPAAEAALCDVEAADFAVKSGRMTTALALELLVCQLASRANPTVSYSRR